jgi:hypothetical protein
MKGFPIKNIGNERVPQSKKLAMRRFPIKNIGNERVLQSKI